MATEDSTNTSTAEELKAQANEAFKGTIADDCDGFF